MALYQIDYDLRAPGRNYDSLISAIKAYDTWAKVLKSTWIIETYTSAVTVRDNLKRHLDNNDGLIVTRLTGEAAWVGLSPDVSQWLAERLKRAA